MPSRRAISAIVANSFPSKGPSPSVSSAAEAMCSRGITRMCVGARGAMSRNATITSSSWTIVEGIVPAAILQNRQSGSVRIEGCLRRRDDIDETAEDTVGLVGVDAVDRDPAQDVLQAAWIGRIDRDQRVIGGVARPPAVT